MWTDIVIIKRDPSLSLFFLFQQALLINIIVVYHSKIHHSTSIQRLISHMFSYWEEASDHLVRNPSLTNYFCCIWKIHTVTCCLRLFYYVCRCYTQLLMQRNSISRTFLCNNWHKHLFEEFFPNYVRFNRKQIFFTNKCSCNISLVLATTNA